MKRSLTPEILDSLPPDDPAALRSRRDLRAFNAILGGKLGCERALPGLLRPGERLLEIGAGTGEFGARLARKLPAWDGLDRCPRPPGWPAQSRWHRADAFAFEGWRDYQAVIGSLIFHHFDAEALRALGGRIAAHARLVVACEPVRRRRYQWAFAVLCRLIGAHPVSRHDGWVSIEAGFLGDELPEALGLAAPEWRCRVTATARGSYRPGGGKARMSERRPVEIIGGGLAGLALGLALRREGVPTTIVEAGDYPRHRVCGEFIAGLGEDTIARLGLGPFLADAGRLSEVEWFARGRPTRRHRLPSPALALSRHTLDARLAAAFTAAGGRLLTRTRGETEDAPPGRVFATGRRRSDSPWLGLKLHARGLRLASDLELHLGDDAYVGLCPIEDGQVNVCGLFRRRPGVAGDRAAVLSNYLRACGLAELADRIDAGETDPASATAVAGLGFDRHGASPGRMNLGDTFAMIPPFTGNGMAMAFQSAELALDPLVAWSGGALEWEAAIRLTAQRLRGRFRRRLATAHLLHPFLHSRPRQGWLALAARSGMLPLRPLYRALH